MAEPSSFIVFLLSSFKHFLLYFCACKSKDFINGWRGQTTIQKGASKVPNSKELTSGLRVGACDMIAIEYAQITTNSQIVSFLVPQRKGLRKSYVQILKKWPLILNSASQSISIASTRRREYATQCKTMSYYLASCPTSQSCITLTRVSQS